MRPSRFSSISPALAEYLSVPRKRTTDGKDPTKFCEKAERAISLIVPKEHGISVLTESIVKDIYGGTSLMNSSYELRNAIMREVPNAPAISALDLVLVAAAMQNAEWLNLADSVTIRGSNFNPESTRAEGRAAGERDKYDVRPPVKVGSGKAKAPGFQAKDPYAGKQELDSNILAQAPFTEVIALFGTYEQAPRFLKFELFPIAYKLAGNKPEVLTALLLPESIGTFSTRAAFYTDLKNALAARKAKIPSIAVAEKIVQRVLSDRALGLMPEHERKGDEAILKGLTGKPGRANVQQQPSQELPEQFIKSLPPILDPDPESKSW
jgi:hypothetical protein